MTITLEKIKETLGESLHTGLRKLCDNTRTSVLHNEINNYPNEWIIYLDIVKDRLPKITSAKVMAGLYDAATAFVDINSLVDESKPFRAALKVMTLEDFGGMGGYLADDLKTLENTKESLLVNCDTVDKAIIFACTYETLEEALSWICTWEHENALKRESTDTWFSFITDAVVAHYKEKETKFIAFWQHDLFPFLLSSQVTKFLPNGDVETKQYKGMIFSPVHIMEKTIGDKYASALKDLSEERNTAQQNLNKTFYDKLEVINKGYTK